MKKILISNTTDRSIWDSREIRTKRMVKRGQGWMTWYKWTDKPTRLIMTMMLILMFSLIYHRNSKWFRNSRVKIKNNLIVVNLRANLGVTYS